LKSRSYEAHPVISIHHFAIHYPDMLFVSDVGPLLFGRQIIQKKNMACKNKKI
jgi:hypothetical protein